METQELKRIGEEAVKATNALKELHTQVKGDLTKLDTLDEAKFQAIDTAITKSAEASTKAVAAEKALGEEKAAREKLQTELDELKNSSGTESKAQAERIEVLELALQRQPVDDAKADKERETRMTSAFNKFAREAKRDVSFEEFVAGDAEFKDLVVGSQPDGGFFVTPQIERIRTERIYETTPMRTLADQLTITQGDAVEFPIDNDEISTGGWVGEVQARPNTDTPKLGMQRIPVHEQYANPRVSQKMLDDAGIDIEAWLAGKISDKFARIENTAFLLGTGTGMPRGLLTYDNVATPGAYQSERVERFNSGASGQIGGYDALTLLVYGLKDEYQPNAKFLGKRGTLGALKRIKDGEGRPIFDFNYDGRLGSETILGKEYVAADDMPAVAPNAIALAYGDFKRAYLIVDKNGIRTLRDPYTAKPFVQFYTTKRAGGDVVNFEAYKLLQLSA